MRNSNLLKWAQNSKQNDKGNRNWIHPPDALQKGHIAYLVKFLGSTEVDQPKGIEVVKEGIRKLKFNQQLRKSEGTKIPKVELTISIDGVAIQEPKTKRIIHQYPLHRISYCADDKGEKKSFSFIAKDCPDSERHTCFVFVSDKLAEEITLTIGQAFDLAYKRFRETSGKDLEVQRRVLLLQQRVKNLEHENTALRQRLSDVLNGQANDLDGYMRRNNIKDMLVVEGTVTTDLGSPDSAFSSPTNGTETNGLEMNGLLLNLSSSSSSAGSLVSGSPGLPPVPPRSFEKTNNLFGDEVPIVGRKLEGLLLDEMDSEEEFNPRASEWGHSGGVVGSNGGVANTTNSIAPPLPRPRPPTAAPLPSPLPPPTLSSASLDPFGMDQFVVNPPPPHAPTTPFPPLPLSSPPPPLHQAQIESALGILDKRLLEMKDGFSRGLAFGNDDFSIESLDPLRK